MTVKIDGTNTEANPAFTGADTDTGLQCGTNELKLVVGGTAAATFDSNGNLGINTSSPVKQLQVGAHGSSSEGTIALASTTSGTCSILMGDGATGTNVYRGYVQYNHTDDAMLFATSSSERMRITSDGYVTKANHPAFEVSNNPGDVTNGLLAPSHVQMNRGSHYSTSNGVFTAPVTGVYCFYYGSIKQSDNSQVVRVYMRVNNVAAYDSKHLRLADDSGNYGENASITWTHYLAKDDQVRLYVGAGNIYGSTQEYFHFGGYLIG